MRARHVGDADDAVVVVGVAAVVLDLLPVAVGLEEPDLAAEPVGVGHDQRALGAVDLDAGCGGAAQTSKLSETCTTAPA